MAMAPKPFPFVAIEGLDGSGKTQARRWIFDRLERRRLEPLAIIKNGWLDVAATRTITAARYFGEMPADLDELAAACLADKRSLSERIIRPHRAVRPIIADRFLLSDVVYGDVQFGIDWRRTRDLYLASAIERPSHTLFVHASPELCAERLAQRADAPVWRWERLEMQRRVASLFEVVLDDPATRPLYGRLERIANEGSCTTSRPGSRPLQRR
jgi:dTMP kinase